MELKTALCLGLGISLLAGCVSEPSREVSDPSAKIWLQDGSVINGTLLNGSLQVQTLCGAVNLPIAQIETLQAKCRQVPQSNHHKDGLVFS